MNIARVTGSAGLVGSEATRFLVSKGMTVVGIDNDMRKEFFGIKASTDWNRRALENDLSGYIHRDEGIRDKDAIERIFCEYGTDIALVLHTAAQPSHDWAATAPATDFEVNANGTMNLLEATRQNCPDAVFIFTSTNKVYGDKPNQLPLIEWETRWEIDEVHEYADRGIDESMGIDQTLHSLFGVSKAAADIMVQEYGKYFGIKTGVFRGGCLTGPAHSGTELHGFLAYLMKCAVTGRPYSVFGYKGKQVRDNIHSYDLVNAFWSFYKNPRIAEVYNIGGSRYSNCSVLEAISKCEEICQKKIKWSYEEANRLGDHIWWITDISKFKSHYRDWDFTYSIDNILLDLFNVISLRNN